jgi:hypothetical protein
VFEALRRRTTPLSDTEQRQNSTAHKRYRRNLSRKRGAQSLSSRGRPCLSNSPQDPPSSDTELPTTRLSVQAVQMQKPLTRCKPTVSRAQEPLEGLQARPVAERLLRSHCTSPAARNRHPTQDSRGRTDIRSPRRKTDPGQSLICWDRSSSPRSPNQGSRFRSSPSSPIVAGQSIISPPSSSEPCAPFLSSLIDPHRPTT